MDNKEKIIIEYLIKKALRQVECVENILLDDDTGNTRRILGCLVNTLCEIYEKVETKQE